MPRSKMMKVDIEARLYRLKTELYDTTHENKPGLWHDGAHHFLNKVLDSLNEYRC